MDLAGAEQWNRAELLAVVEGAEDRLRQAGTAERAHHEQRYLKSSLEHAGTSLPEIRSTAKHIRSQYPHVQRTAVFTLSGELWAKPLHERRMLAVVILQLYAHGLAADDLERLEPFLRDSHTWALVDGLSGDVAADIVRRHPCEAIVDRTLRRWSDDEDFWIRRAAILAHLGMVGRTGDFAAWERLSTFADAMLEEREFFIRKAIGWVLRQAGKRRADLVVDFVTPRIDRISGVTIREAVRYLEPDDRDTLLASYRSRSARKRSQRVS